MSVANTKVANTKVGNTKNQPMLRPMCNCAFLPGSHFADKCAKVAESRQWAQRASDRAQKKLEREENNAKRQQEWKARQEQREQDPEWQRRYDAYLRHQAKRDAEAKAKADQEAADAKAQAQLEADRRLKAQAKAHQQLLAKLEADRQKAQQEAEAAQKAADVNKIERDLLRSIWLDAKAAQKKTADEQTSDVASTAASETSHVPKRPERRERHSGPVLYFNKEEARRLEKVKAALNEIHWLQKQVDAGKKYELDRSQFAKIHGKHAENRIKELEGSDVLRMERAGYKLREKYY